MTGESTTEPIPAAPKPPWLHPLVVGRNPKWTLVRIGVLVVASFVLFKFVLLPIRVVGISMAPNYRNGHWNFVNKLAYRNSQPQRGDVVAIRMAGESVLLCKRIIGLPGERVTIRKEGVFINNNLLEESYVKLQVHASWYRVWFPKRDWKLGDDEYLVIGDNRSMNFDDHTKGTPRLDQIVGKVVF